MATNKNKYINKVNRAPFNVDTFFMFTFLLIPDSSILLVLDSFNPNLKFTIEVENNLKNPFSDIFMNNKRKYQSRH